MTAVVFPFRPKFDADGFFLEVDDVFLAAMTVAPDARCDAWFEYYSEGRNAAFVRYVRHPVGGRQERTVLAQLPSDCPPYTSDAFAFIQSHLQDLVWWVTTQQGLTESKLMLYWPYSIKNHWQVEFCVGISPLKPEAEAEPSRFGAWFDRLVDRALGAPKLGQ